MLLKKLKGMFWFYIFSSTYGMIGANRFFVSGYGPLSFIGLYLLAQYVRNIQSFKEVPTFLDKIFHLDKSKDLLVFLSCAIVNTLIAITSLKIGINLNGFIYAYSNPLNVIGALYLFLFFTKINIGHNSLINWLAASSFAVYLLHCNQMREYFIDFIQYIYNMYDGFACFILIFIFLIMVYLVSTLIDQLRIISWNLLSNLKDKWKVTKA